MPPLRASHAADLDRRLEASGTPTRGASPSRGASPTRGPSPHSFGHHYHAPADWSATPVYTAARPPSPSSRERRRLQFEVPRSPSARGTTPRTREPSPGRTLAAIEADLGVDGGDATLLTPRGETPIKPGSARARAAFFEQFQAE